MKTRFGKFGLVFLALTLCLAGTGAAFAKWCDSVTVLGSVNTGEVKIGIFDLGVLDLGADPQAVTDLWSFSNDEGKDVAKHESLNNGQWVCDKLIVSPPNWPDPLGFQQNVAFVDSISENVYNAYPGYKSGGWIYIGNCGTIPVKIEDIDLTVTSDPKTLAPFLILGNYRVWNWVTDASGASSWVESTYGPIFDDALNGLQIHPCHYACVYFEFWFAEDIFDANGGVIGTMPQGADMTFEITVEACQWNESKW
jgi:hypothetical protein